MRLLAVSLLLLLPLLAQDDQKKGKGGGRPPQNLKVLKLEPGQSIGAIMRTYTAGLGVECNLCHVQGNFAADDNPKKDIARKMIQMVDGLNAQFNAAMGDTKAHITCFTCHRGETTPKTEAAKPAAQ